MRKLLAVLAGVLLAVACGVGLAIAISAAAPTSAATAASPVVLLGSTAVQPVSDGGAGTSEAFGYVAGQSGTATDAEVYLQSTGGVRIGLYADSAGKPGARLDSGTVTANTTGWVDVPLTAGVQITQGVRYWLAIAAYSGHTITYRDVGSSGSGYDYSGSGLRNPYSITGHWQSNPASVYLNGTVTGGSTTTSTTTSSSTTTPTTTTTSTTSTTPTTTTSTTSTTSTTPPPPPPGAYQLPADRTYDWNPGLNSIGGIPSGSWAVYKTISPSGGDDTATIQAALDSCPKNGVIQLAAGVFHIAYSLQMEHSYCVLRGVGPGPGNWPTGTAASGTGGTYLVKNTSGDRGPVMIMGPLWGNNHSYNITNLTADAAKGDRSVTVASTAGLSAGNLVVLDETTDTNISRWQGGNAAEFNAWFEESDRPLGDVMEVKSVAGNTITFTTDLPIGYQVAHAAHLFPLMNVVAQSGLEDLYIYGGLGGDGGGGVHFWNCDHCWVKHIEASYNDEPINIDFSFGTEIRDSYIHDAPGGLHSNSASYGIALDWYTSNTLVENNIVRMFNKVDVMRSAGGGNVLGYNYMDDGADLGGQWEENGINTSHMTTPHYELIEGNQAYTFDQDETWGNSVYVTYFRNDSPGYNSDFQAYGPYRGMGVGQWHWWQSFVGNVLGTPTDQGLLGNTYEVLNGDIETAAWTVCWLHGEPNPDGGKCLATVLRDGNFDYVSKKVHWHGIGGTGVNNGLTPPANATLPNSLYLTGKPAFFGSSAWPWVDGSNATNPIPGSLPARARYDAGTPNG